MPSDECIIGKLCPRPTVETYGRDQKSRPKGESIIFRLYRKQRAWKLFNPEGVNKHTSGILQTLITQARLYSSPAKRAPRYVPEILISNMTHMLLSDVSGTGSAVGSWGYNTTIWVYSVVMSRAIISLVFNIQCWHLNRVTVETHGNILLWDSYASFLHHQATFK